MWWDSEISPGQEFDHQITAELNAAAAVVVVWTPTSVVSRWVRGEARVAADRNVLVPVRFDSADLPIDVRAIHTTDLDGWGEDPYSPALQDLLRALGSMIANRGKRSGLVGSAPLTPATAPARAGISICVLPFVNMSGDPEQEYFSDGISEDIITDLSKVSALFVVARNTAFTFKAKNVVVPQIARELNVSHVLEGSVRKAAGRVRITAQLIDGSTGGHVWAERFDRDLNDIFALQDEISEAIVKALRLKLLPDEKKAIEQRGTENVEAYNLLLMARQHYATGFQSDVRKADTVIRLCRAAIGLDPNYARAWALMAMSQRMRMYSTTDGDDGSLAATRALELDANLAEAHAAMAGVLALSGDDAAAAKEIEIALRLDPESVDVHKEAARLLLSPTPLRGGRHTFREGLDLGRDRLCSRRPADHLLYGSRRSRRRAGGRATHAVPGRESRRARVGQRLGDGSRLQLSRVARRNGESQGLGTARDPDRSGQHDHALQHGLRPGGQRPRCGGRARVPRPGVQESRQGPFEMAAKRSGSRLDPRPAQVREHARRSAGTTRCGERALS